MTKTMFPRRQRVGAEWFRNPRSQRFHAYAVGPGQGDATLCGRTVLDGAARELMTENEVRCTYCTAVIRDLIARAVQQELGL